MTQLSREQAQRQATNNHANSEGALRTSKGRHNTNNIYSTNPSLSMIMKLRALGLKAASQLATNLATNEREHPLELR